MCSYTYLPPLLSRSSAPVMPSLGAGTCSMRPATLGGPENGEILLTSLSLGCFSISSLRSSTQFWGAELSPSPLQLIQGDLWTTTFQMGRASLAAQAEERGNCPHTLQGCPKLEEAMSRKAGLGSRHQPCSSQSSNNKKKEPHVAKLLERAGRVHRRAT